MDTYQLDTNVLLRFLTQDIPNQYRQVIRFINKAKRSKTQLFICEPVFVETAVMLKNYFKFPKDKIVNFLKDLLNSPYFSSENKSQLLLAVDSYSQNSIDFVDAILLIRAQTHQHKIFTFDSKLLQISSVIPS